VDPGIESYERGQERLVMTSMNRRDAAKLARRDLLRVLAIGGAAATTSACASGEAGGDASDFPDQRKAHYQADSPEVQTFYRVNRYPAK
jgi:hypothetical protein